MINPWNVQKQRVLVNLVQPSPNPEDERIRLLLKASSFNIFPTSEPDFVYWNGIFRASVPPVNLQRPIVSTTNAVTFVENRSSPILQNQERYKFKIRRFELPTNRIPYYITDPTISAVSLPPGRTGLKIALNVTVLPRLTDPPGAANIKYAGSYFHDFFINELIDISRPADPNSANGLYNIQYLISALNDFLAKAFAAFVANPAFLNQLDPQVRAGITENYYWVLPYFSFDFQNGFQCRVPGNAFWFGKNFNFQALGIRYFLLAPNFYVNNAPNPAPDGTPWFTISVSDSLKEILQCFSWHKQALAQGPSVNGDAITVFPDATGFTWGPFGEIANPQNCYVFTDIGNILLINYGEFFEVPVQNIPAIAMVNAVCDNEYYPCAIDSIRILSQQVACPSENMQALDNDNANATDPIVTDFLLNKTLAQFSGNTIIYNSGPDDRWINLTSSGQLVQPSFGVVMADRNGNSYPFTLEFGQTATIKLQFAVKQETLGS